MHWYIEYGMILSLYKLVILYYIHVLAYDDNATYQQESQVTKVKESELRKEAKKRTRQKYLE